MSNILIVDDDNYLRSLYGEVFREAGFSVSEARDGAEGLDLARSQKPELIFTGIMMPNLNGFELMGKLRENPETASIPVMISSHLGRDSDRQQAEKLGAKAFVIKGFVSPKQVVNLALSILGGKKAEQKTYRLKVASDQLDDSRLARELGIDGGIIVELSRAASGLLNEFQAKVISDTGTNSGPGRSTDDVSKVLTDIEKKFKQSEK